MTSTPEDPTVAGLPDSGPATVAAVREHVGLADGRDTVRVQRIVDAVNSQVRRWPVCDPARGQADWQLAADAVEGAVMLAARLYRRKNSPAGVETFGSEGAVYVQRNDPDLAQLLQLGQWAGPMVG